LKSTGLCYCQNKPTGDPLGPCGRPGARGHQVGDPCYRPAQFSGTEFENENSKYGICALSSAPPRFGLLVSCRRFVQYGVRNCESTLMQLWKCFTVSPLRPACLAMLGTTMKTKGEQLQRAYKARWSSTGSPREILPGDTETDTRPPSFWRRSSKLV